MATLVLNEVGKYGYDFLYWFNSMKKYSFQIQKTPGEIKKKLEYKIPKNTGIWPSSILSSCNLFFLEWTWYNGPRFFVNINI